LELTDEEKKALVDETIEKAKTALALEAKADIEKINKLITDQRTQFDGFLKGKTTEADFKEYEEKSLKAEAEVKKRVDEIETKMSRLPLETPGGKQSAEVKAGQVEYKAAFFNYMRNGGLILDDAAGKYIAERKALVSDDTGRILIPVEVENEIYRELPAVNVIRSLATVRPISREKLRRRSLTEVQMGWGKLELGGEPVETDVVPSEDFQWIEDLEGMAKVGKDELADTDVSLESIIVDSFSRAKGNAEEAAYISGTGHANQQPEGMLNGTTLTRVKTVAADVIATNDVLDLIYAVPAQYRRNGKLLFPSTTILALRKLKDGVGGGYMWQPSNQAGQPASFGGYPVIAQETIGPLGASSECDVGIFGDFKAGYRNLDRKGMTIQRLLELYATAGLIGILVSSRVTGGVVRPDALRVLQELA